MNVYSTSTLRKIKAFIFCNKFFLQSRTVEGDYPEIDKRYLNIKALTEIQNFTCFLNSAELVLLPIKGLF